MIKEIRKSNSEKIVISKSVYRGKERVDIRVHYFDVDAGGVEANEKGSVVPAGVAEGSR